MIGVLIYLAGIGTGVWLAGAIYGFAMPSARRSMPAATPRAIARMARRNRADLRRMLPAREVGVRVIRDRTVP